MREVKGREERKISSQERTMEIRIDREIERERYIERKKTRPVPSSPCPPPSYVLSSGNLH